jgi:DNA-binding NarL/FixJ family response regulator
MIRVCVVEDQMLVRQGIQTLLGLVDDVEVVAEAVDGDQAIELIPRLKPDVVLLDMYLPRRSGLDVLRTLSASQTLPPTLTTFDEDELVIGGLQAGARGFLLKDVSLERLTAAIRALADGGTWIQPALTERLLQHRHRLSTDFPAAEPCEPPSNREREILRLMARGYNNREIAEALAITEGTAKNYVSSILAKMGVRDRTRAVLKALEAGDL